MEDTSDRYMDNFQILKMNDSDEAFFGTSISNTARVYTFMPPYNPEDYKDITAKSLAKEFWVDYEASIKEMEEDMSEIQRLEKQLKEQQTEFLMSLLCPSDEEAEEQIKTKDHIN